jgi:Holliday junction DNA helicase RuvA
MSSGRRKINRMIAYIKGEVEAVGEDSLVIDRDGIGFRIFVSGRMLDGSVKVGQKIKIHTYLNVREDALQLYGFYAEEELEIFKLLTGVSGIGPKAALGILSALNVDELRFAILSDDVKYITKAPGIGKKTAQKLILELKDKFSLEDAFEKKLKKTEAGQEADQLISRQAEKDAIDALVALGYSNTQALQAIRQADIQGIEDSEQILKAALKVIF